MEIRDNVFLITGGASGLGAATARLFAAEGGKIVVADLNQDAGVALAQELGGVFVKCDVSREEDATQAVEAATRSRAARASKVRIEWPLIASAFAPSVSEVWLIPTTLISLISSPSAFRNAFPSSLECPPAMMP